MHHFTIMRNCFSQLLSEKIIIRGPVFVVLFLFFPCSISVPGLEAKCKAGNLVVEGPWGDGTLFQALTSTTVVTYIRHQKAYYISYPLPCLFSLIFFFHVLCACINRRHSLCSLWTKLSVG